MMLSDISAAKDAFEKSLKYEPDNADCLAYLGYVYMLNGDNERANEILQEAIKIEPDNFLVNSHIAKFYFQNKKFDTAKQFLLDLVQKTQDDETMNMLAVCHLEAQEYSEAIGIFYKLSLMYPQNHILLTNLAKCEYECGKTNEASEHLRQALMIFDDYKEALELLKEINDGK